MRVVSRGHGGERLQRNLAAYSPEMRSSLSPSPPQRPEQKLLWLKALREHLSRHVIPVATAVQGPDLDLQSLQASALVALAPTAGETAGKHGGSPGRAPQSLPLDSEVVSVSGLKRGKKSFRVNLYSPASAGRQTTHDEGEPLSPSTQLLRSCNILDRL